MPEVCKRLICCPNNNIQPCSIPFRKDLEPVHHSLNSPCFSSIFCRTDLQPVRRGVSVLTALSELHLFKKNDLRNVARPGQNAILSYGKMDDLQMHLPRIYFFNSSFIIHNCFKECPLLPEFFNPSSSRRS